MYAKVYPEKVKTLMETYKTKLLLFPFTKSHEENLIKIYSFYIVIHPISTPNLNMQKKLSERYKMQIF